MSQPASQVPDSFYIVHEKIHAREVSGRFDRMRKLAVVVLLGIYYLLPFLTWNDRQAILFDLPARKFYMFGITFWPQDFFYLSLILIIAALTLFFFTALLGRIWCGYACPQTVWTEVFVWMERLTEGKAARRRKLDKGPWTREKILRKGAKQFLWISFSLWTGITFVGYFTPVRDLFQGITSFGLGPWETFWCLFYSAATYGNAGFLREQVCKYMCPYARFQSAMFDHDTLIVSYDEKRGEPRGGRKRGIDPADAGLGSCVDCNMCVQVCPTGIDIREGLQYECIACALCVDVCDSVMDKMDYPRGLIRYSSESAMTEGKPLSILRPRVIIYAVLLLVLVTGFSVSLGQRMPLRMDTIRDRNSLYREIEPGVIENVYTLKIINLDGVAHRYRLEASGMPELTIDVDPAALILEPGEVRRVPISIRASGSDISAGGKDIDLRLEAIDAPDIAVESATRFLGPVPSR
ncbi:MAG: cytochrome c oxidase accessory protein CcoG [Gammaproteobacteria bacterium]